MSLASHHVPQFCNILICSVSVNFDFCKLRFNLIKFIIGQLYIDSIQILLNWLWFSGTGNRYDKIFFVEHPRKRNLCCSNTFLISKPVIKSKSGWFAKTFSLLNRVITLRTSSPVYVLSTLYFPDRNPLARGLNGTKPIPSFSQVGITSFSNIRSIKEYSLWIAVIGVTSWARRISSSVDWDCPHARILPSWMSVLMHQATSSTGMSLFTRC
jgi:hypothetical protein